jgi:hypothetical protein
MDFSEFFGDMKVWGKFSSFRGSKIPEKICIFFEVQKLFGVEIPRKVCNFCRREKKIM